MNKKIRITVLKAEVDQELEKKYAISNLGPCPWHQKGQVLYSDGIHQPENMCGVAWQFLAPSAESLSKGELLQPSGTWLKDDSVCVAACPGGVRPVIFLMEAIDQFLK